jgi:hypothetical protein
MRRSLVVLTLPTLTGTSWSAIHYHNQACMVMRYRTQFVSNGMHTHGHVALEGAGNNECHQRD